MTDAVILLAAGASRRFGPQNKLLAPFRGRALVAHAAEAARSVRAGWHIAVLSDDAVAALLPGFRRVVVAPGQPQSESLKAGLALARAMGAERVLVVLGDMPLVPAHLMQQVLDACGDTGAALANGAAISPPAALPARLFDAIAGLTGDQGAGALLRDLPASQRIAPPPGVLADVDTLSDLQGLAP